jgi:hypothetical protein
LPSISLHDVCSLILFPFPTTPAAKFSTISPSVVVTGGKFPAGVVDTCGNFAAVTSGKFATGVVYTGGAP